MPSTFTITFTDPSKPSFEIAPLEFDGPDHFSTEPDKCNSSLHLFGHGNDDYGVRANENFLRLLENFASSTPPVKPTVGQLWFDVSANALKIYDNTLTWVPLGSTTPTPGQTGITQVNIFAFNNQTLFSGLPTYVSGNSGNLSIYVNGVKQSFPSSYVETSTTSITLSLGAVEGDMILGEIFPFVHDTGSGVSHVIKLEQTATTGTITAMPVPSFNPSLHTLMVWVNGVKQVPGTAYTANSGQIVFSSPISVGDIVETYVLTIVNTTGSGLVYQLVSATAGQNTINLSTPINIASDSSNQLPLVFINGIRQHIGTFTIMNSTTIVFSTPLQLNDVVEVYVFGVTHLR